ncbi:transcriptional regulator [Arthrobacter sp. 18067]|uniref:helix-turn-helix transcriptional regulator n=1 Tax=Arthrobacter sp. 18067 TaxID=2681413 RepID=UPI00135A98DA|nr:PAS domain-containing protein [Arthrobacter sp. 18067]
MSMEQPDEVAVNTVVEPRRSLDGERLIALFTDMVDLLASVLPPDSEVILHDFSKMPNSIVAIKGDVTGRRPGGPATNYLISKVRSGDFEHEFGYTGNTSDGRALKSSTMIIRDVAGTPVGALCINVDLSAWDAMKKIVDRMTSSALTAAGQEQGPSERFAASVDELATGLIDQALVECPVPLEDMKKRHKLNVVKALDERGFFLIKDGVEMIAAKLGVTRFTIYNYLNEATAHDAE